MDFMEIRVEHQTSGNRKNDIIIYPDFIIGNTNDIICKGEEMYAFWYDGAWRDSIDDLVAAVDKELLAKKNEVIEQYPGRRVGVRLMRYNSTKVMKEFMEYTKRVQQSNIQFNKRIIFSDEEIKREDYATSKLSYTPSEGDTPAFDEMFDLLYEDDELEKILWFAGALLTNSMRDIQKFLYLYGGKGSGKGTALKTFKLLFEGYHGSIDLQTLTSNSQFATSQVREIPLLIDDDSDISRIQDDTNLLKMTAHEPVTVNKKYRSEYEVTFDGLLITASNQRFRVRNIDSGITRRAVVSEPTGKTHDFETYHNLMERIKYEIPHIAWRAMRTFKNKGAFYYEDYMDVDMAIATDHVYAFVREHYNQLGDPTTLKRASELYRLYLEEIGFDSLGYKRKIKNELQRYYGRFEESKRIDGVVTRNVFSDFKYDQVFPEEFKNDEIKPLNDILDEMGLKDQRSTFDNVCKDYQAQEAVEVNGDMIPKQKWDNVVTTLNDVNTRELHFVRLPLNHIVIDFDKKNINGEKDLMCNLKEAQKFPPTYMELSKSGQGVHLHYIYDGDVTKLAPLYDDDIEIKIFTGKSSLRRKLTLNNGHDISMITTGLPKKQKGGVRVFKDVEIITWNEKKMRTAIKGNLEKKYHDYTKPSMDFITHIFKQAEETGVKYDLRDMRQDILAFASQSTNQAQTCIRLANSINYCTIDNENDAKKFQEDITIVDKNDIYFYDIEVFPNLFLVAYKKYGDKEVDVMINPSPEEIEDICKKPLIGFNNRRYDNHIMYARLLGEDNLKLYQQSQRIINGDGPNGMYSGAYELSYADIYEYSSKKQSLKKWQIELGIHHDELELPWDQPVPEELWERVAEYCKNDVVATEAVFDATYHDYNARLILASLSGLKVNATTTQHAASFLFGNDPKPQDKFIYTDLSEEFKGYSYSFGKSSYRGEDPGEGGYVYSEPGIYNNVVELDIASMHPWSLINMDYFGPYTKRFKDLVETRIYIKHKDYNSAREMFGGILKPYLKDESTASQLSYALKIIINIVYGMTSAKFDNKFKHPRNDDNIVAKRGALFMIDLKHAIQEKGYSVCHIKTDSVKIPNADDDIIQFVKDYGKKWGYEFDIDGRYEAMALVNKAVLIGRYSEGKETRWHTVGAMFQEPYVYKRLLSKEPITEEDYAVTKSATKPIYIGEKFIGRIANVYASHSGEELKRVDKEKDKVSYISGTKGYKWNLFSEYKGKDDVNISYYEDLVSKAVKAIEKVGDPNNILIDFNE